MFYLCYIILNKFRHSYKIHLNNKNKLQDKIIVTGIVNTQAKAIFIIVPFCKFFNHFFATIEPAMPDYSMCVVLTGNPKADARPIPPAATNSALAP